jgi:hypothetical protein
MGDAELAVELLSLDTETRKWLLGRAQMVPDNQTLAVPPAIAEAVPSCWLEVTPVWWFEAEDPFPARILKPTVVAYLRGGT